MKKLYFLHLFSLIIITQISIAQQLVSNKFQKGDFKLYYNNKVAPILFDKTDFKVVEITCNLLSDDVEMVTGTKPIVNPSTPIKSNIIIVGTLNNSKLIDELVKKKLIDTTGLNGKWETFSIQTINNPYTKGEKALIIVGSDRRGTAYGVLELSKQMGVSPWYWWADVPVKKKTAVLIKNGKFSNGTPAVKYRGIFINDEDWGMQPWSSKTFEPELGNIGPKTYAKICELLLRLKANYLWPAMHPCTGGFNQYPENKVVADNFAIIMGSSHHEPLLFNTEGEWDEKVKGEWNYVTNKERMYNQLDHRVQENGKYENIYTVGMRGLGDYGIAGDFTVEERIKITENAINDQRNILEKNLGKKASEIPQIFVPYAEVLHLYNNGLKIPNDVTLMWVDDNYGYIRRLSDPIEAKRPGGSGVYYHIAYLGNPHEYTWLSTTNPALIYEEMKKSFDYGANKVWMVNVGDIKPAEYNTTFFLDLAWDINTVNHTNVYSHQKKWYQEAFGNIFGEKCADLMKTYYQLNFERKPEFMGWGEEYASVQWRERVEDTHYSFSNYNEAENRISKFNILTKKAKALFQLVSEENKAAFYQLVYYPIVGATYNNNKLLLAQKNRFYAKLNHSLTNKLGEDVKAYQDSLRMITHTYESLKNGKWKEIMSEIQSYGATFAYLPPLDSIAIQKKGELGILVEENKPTVAVNTPLSLPIFTSFYNETYAIKLFNKGTETIDWKATISDPWIQLSQNSGKIINETTITITTDWSKTTNKENSYGSILFESGKNKYTVNVKTFNPTKSVKDAFKNRFVEKNGYISIPIEDFHRKVETTNAQFITYEGLGLTRNAIGIASNKAKTAGHWIRNDEYAHMEFDIYTFNSGRFDIYTYMLPTYPINGFQLHRIAISVDNESPKTMYVGASIDSESWRNNVRRNSSIHKSSHYIDKPGKHTVKVFYADPGVIYDKINIDFGGLKNSYLGPKKTFINE